MKHLANSSIKRCKMSGKESNQLFHVPFLPSEWNTVKNAFENRNGANCFEALQVLSAWRLRSASALPFTVQASEILIQAVLNDPVLLGDVVEKNVMETENIRLIYGMAVTRFVNYVTERDRVSGLGNSIAEICRRHGIPNWVVDVRHAATHGNLPSLNALREAIDFCWGWLRAHYWNHGLLRGSNDDKPMNTAPRPMLTRRKMPAIAASTSAASGCWPLADDDIPWADLPIGLGPGQNLYDLDFRIKPHGQEPPVDSGPSNNEVDGEEVVHSKDDVSVQGVPAAANPPPPEEWSEEKRLELVESLISFLGE